MKSLSQIRQLNAQLNTPQQVDARINLFSLSSDDYVFPVYLNVKHFSDATHYVIVHLHPKGEQVHGTHEGWIGQRGYHHILGNLHAHFMPDAEEIALAQDMAKALASSEFKTASMRLGK